MCSRRARRLMCLLCWCHLCFITTWSCQNKSRVSGSDSAASSNQSFFQKKHCNSLFKTGSYCIEFSLTAVYLSAAWFSKLIPVLLPVPCRQKSFYRLTMSTMCIYISCGKNWLWFVLKAQSSSCTFTCLRSATWIPNGDVRRLPCCSPTTTS